MSFHASSAGTVHEPHDALERRNPGARLLPVLGRIVALLGLALLLAAVPQARIYEKIRVPVTPDLDRSALFFHPDLELMGDDDGALILLSRPELTAELRARGFEVEVQIPDLEAYYSSRCVPMRDYGIWHTYSEMVDEMNAIHAEFPDLTTAPASIGTTGQGRVLWAMKVSDNPNVQEDEPEVLFDGVHHAREIMALEIPLHFIRYLCENYGTDPVITFIVNNRQVWFVPMVNVDGFVYNEQTNPNGGGMWRKNRRDNGISGCEGVDPNRNYTFQWGGEGSSGNPCDETYRGPSAGSEPEIQAHMNFINAHQFVTWETYHSVAGQILLPWGYTTTPTPDNAIFMAMGNEMARDSGYQVGQCSIILYMVSGGAFDWGYGSVGQHNKIFAVSTEIGGSDFWPDPSERDGLIAENLYSNIYLCLVAGGYAELTTLAVTGGDGNGRLDPGETVSLVPTVHNPGVLYGIEDVTATLLCQDPYIALHDAATSFGDLGAGQSATATADPFDLSVAADCPEGRMVSFTVRLQAAGGLEVDVTRELRVGEPPLLYACDFEQANHGWTQDPTHTAATGAFVRIDPVATQFQPEDDTTPAPGIYGWITAQNPGGNVGIDDVDNGISATRSPVIDLTGASHVLLDLNYFHGQRDAGDDNGDFFRIDVSNDGGASWPANLVFVGDVTHTAEWRNLQVNLEEHIALTSQMLVRVQAADGIATGDIIEGGVDDVFLYDRGDGNNPPSAPVLVSPPEGASGQPPTPTLIVANAVDPEGDPLTYGFQVYADAELTQLVASVAGVPEGAGGQTSWTVTPALALNQTYSWRAYAADPQVSGLCMAAASFTVSDASGIAQLRGNANMPRLTAGPNPAHGAVAIRYYTPATPTASLEILDVSGRVVRTLAGERWSEGWHETHWDGRDDAGHPLGGGLYWVRLVLPEETRTVRVVQLSSSR
jgi:hypothetical protein